MADLEPAPVTDAVEAGRIAAELWGIEDPLAADLGSHQDRNFLIAPAGWRSGAARYVLKVANAAIPVASLDAQNEAMLAVAAAGLPVRTPQPIPLPDGSLRAEVELGGAPHLVRLLSYVEGTPMTGAGHLAPVTARRFGALSGQVCAALSSFVHAGAELPNQWDVRRAGVVVHELLPSVRSHDGALADRIERLSERAWTLLDGAIDALPRQVIHADITDFNVVADAGPDGRPVPAGLIDFGDMMSSWRAAEAAVTICSQLVKDRRAPLRVAEDILRGFLAHQPLTEAEVDALWPMVAARACAGLASTLHQLISEPGNAYLHDNLAVDRAVFDLVDGMPLALGRLAMRRAAALPDQPPAELPVSCPAIPEVTRASMLDLSPPSPLLDHGAWLDPAHVRTSVRAADRALGRGIASVIPYGQPHLHRASVNALSAPTTIHLGIDVLLPRGFEILVPWSGRVAASEPWQTRLLGDDGWDLVVNGGAPEHSPGTTVRAGEVLARTTLSRDAALPEHVHLQVVAAGIDAPSHAPAAVAELWAQLCPDPGALLGLPAATDTGLRPEDRAHDLMQRRHASLADVQHHYWADPPIIERGWRHHLIDATGRVYLDAINNVAVLGHSHPAVAAAVDRAMRTLNTNSRFHYAAQVQFAEELLATMPPELDRVFLLSTGSESVDLALRLARVHTGARDTIALRTAYHGWTTASDEVSSALMDNPRALLTRPEWIHLAEPPNLYRGPFAGPDAATSYANDVRQILAELARNGRHPAAFICEALNGNAGGIELPAGYLRQVYDAVRAAGGVVIADEVQVGYGRLGSHFWGFQAHDVVPDIVCLAKATGNGYPVAAVVCRSQIAESFAAEGSLFSSMGGTPAGAVAGLATLRALRDEDLMGNARLMGDRLRAGLEGLVARHELAGAVHGQGLYLGLELVTDRHSRTPATQATDALCERLLELGVIMAATGDHLNVLKIKPPLCIDEAGVDFLIEALDTAFSEGW